MAAAVGPPGAPLRTLALNLAGRPDAVLPSPHAPAAGPKPSSIPEGLPAAPSPDGPRSTGSGSALSLFGLGRARQAPDPDPSSGGAPAGAPAPGQADPAAAAAVLADWRRNLAALAAHRSPGDEALLVRLGDALWRERSLVPAAHTCYVLAGQAAQWLEPGARLVLPGGDHRACPRTFPGAAALQALEVLEWARSLGAPLVLLEAGVRGRKLHRLVE